MLTDIETETRRVLDNVKAVLEAAGSSLDYESISHAISSRSGRAMAHDEEHERHSAVKQKPVDSLKFTHIWVVAPRLEFVV